MKNSIPMFKGVKGTSDHINGVFDHSIAPLPFNPDVVINHEILDKEVDELMEIEEERNPLWFGTPEQLRAIRKSRRDKIVKEVYKKAIRYKDATEQQIKQYLFHRE